MKRNRDYDSHEAKERKQKESHSEIERKRRERMKKETEYLNQHLPPAERKDKLSIFQAGCDQLIFYSDPLGKRDYIISDSEYTSIIANNFNGFDIHIRCSDGRVLHVHENIQSILGHEPVDVEGMSMYDLCEPSRHTRNLIQDNLTLSPAEQRSCRNSELLRRDFTLSMRVVNPNLEFKCVPSSDECWYRFIEFCGEIVNSTPTSNDSGGESGDEHGREGCSEPILRALCRPHDAASPGTSLGAAAMGITTKHRPDTLKIVEVTGHVSALLGRESKFLIGKELSDLAPPEDRSYVRKNFYDALKTGSIIFICPLEHESGELLRFRIQLSAIDINGKVQFIIAKISVAETDLDDTDDCSTFTSRTGQAPCSTTPPRCSGSLVSSHFMSGSNSSINSVGKNRKRPGSLVAKYSPSSSYGCGQSQGCESPLVEDKKLKLLSNTNGNTENLGSWNCAGLSSAGHSPTNVATNSPLMDKKSSVTSTTAVRPVYKDETCALLNNRELNSTSQSVTPSNQGTSSLSGTASSIIATVEELGLDGSDFSLPHNSSFQDLLVTSGVDLSLEDLFEPNHLQEVVQEDFNDLGT